MFRSRTRLICSIGAVETANQIPQSWLIQAANAPVLQWVFQRNLERVLYGRDDGGSTGPIWKILNSTGMGRSAMHVSKAAVTANELTQGEFAQLYKSVQPWMVEASQLTALVEASTPGIRLVCRNAGSHVCSFLFVCLQERTHHNLGLTFLSASDEDSSRPRK